MDGHDIVAQLREEAWRCEYVDLPTSRKLTLAADEIEGLLQTWQPIETFPGDTPVQCVLSNGVKVYQSVLVYGPSQSVYAGDGPNGEYEDPPSIWLASTYDGGEYFVADGGGYDEVLVKPTHWMPLPAPPGETLSNPHKPGKGS